MIHLHSLGQCMITLTSSRLLPASRLTFASALYVTVEGTRSIAREQMASLLWPDMTEESATHALRQMLYRLRTQGMQLDGDAKEVVLPPGSVHRDYDALLASETTPVEQLLERIPGGFLPGYMPTVSEPFSEWVDGQRARVNASLRRQLVAGIAAQRAAGNWPATQALARRCLEIDPLNEEATLAGAEAMAMDGSKALAIVAIDRYMSEIGPRGKEMYLPATMLRKRISDLYPLPPVIERDPPHTGREAEMGRLDAALTEVRQGRGRAFVISGAPGMGKTRLATEFTRAAQLRGLRVARTAMGRHDDHRPLGAWSDLVREMRRMPGALGCDPESLPFLERLTSGTAGDASSREEERDSEYLFARIRMAIVDLVSSVASESCLILWIEDVHWMDEWSWEVMSALTKKFEKTGVLVLMTRREDGGEGASVPAEAVVERMELGPLDDAGCRRLLALVDMRTKQVDEEFAEWCTRTCAGNPYFLIELVRRASRSDGKFLAPPSLTRLIAQRFEDVSPLSRRVLQAAAVLGRNSTLPRIEKVLDERRVSLLASLDELTAHALLVTEGERVVCRHDLLGMSALSGASELTLKLLHRHAAEVLEEEVDEESSPDFIWDCAEHWEKAGEGDRAVEMVRRCATQAIAIGTPAEAVRVLEQGLNWPSTPEKQEELQRVLIGALHLTRDLRRLSDVAASISVARSNQPQMRRPHNAEELYELDAHHWLDGPSEEMLAAALECATSADATPDHRVEAAMMVCQLANNLFRPGVAKLALDSVSAVAPQAHRILTLELNLVYEGSFGSTAKCASSAHEVRLATTHPGSPARRARSLAICTFGFFLDGQVEQAIQCGLEAIQVCDSLELHGTKELALRELTRIHLLMGDLEASRTWLGELDSLSIPDELVQSQFRQEYHARVDLLNGDDAKVLAFIEELEQRMQPVWPRARTHFAAVRAVPRIRSLGWRPTDQEMESLLAMYRESRTFGTQDFFVYMLSFAFEIRGERDAALDLFADYFNIHRRERSPVLRQLRERVELLSGNVGGETTPAPEDVRARA